MENSSGPTLWADLTAAIFDEVQATIAGWTNGRNNLVSVPTHGTLVPAATGSIGSDADWLNEIHPNACGWSKLAAVWRKAIKEVLVS